MVTWSGAFTWFGTALLVLTAISAARAAWRRRDLNHLTILVVFGLLVVAVSGSRMADTPMFNITQAAALAVPYVLLRLVHFFRDVPRSLRITSIFFLIAGSIVIAAWPQPRPAALESPAYLYDAALTMYVTLQFAGESRRTRGVTATRLRWAALGSLVFAAILVLAGLSSLPLSIGRKVAHINGVLTPFVFGAYFMAFRTPRALMAVVQRTEQARYLSLTAERDAEDRGAHAPDDLRQVAAGSVGNAAIVVAVGGTAGATTLVVRSASHPSMRDLTVSVNDGLLGRAFHSGPVSGSPSECGPELSPLLARLGARVLVAPLATSTHAWGLVIVVQRRGSLFPEDDLQLLAQLGKYAATAIDHAALVSEARERDRRAADRRLREAESVMTLMLDSIKDYAMFVVDDHGHVVTWQIGAEHVFGYTSAEMNDQPAGALYGLSDEEFVALLGEARTAGHAEREGDCHKRNGSKFLGLTSIRPLESDVERLGGFVAVTRDVSERRDLENRLRQSLKMEAIGRLAGGIAHDFNNILTAILGYADWLAKDFRNDPPHLQQVSEIQRAAERAAGLTRQLLAFSRQQLLKPAPVGLSRLVGELTPMLRRIIGAQVDIATELTTQPSVVIGDRHQVEQIVVNLVVNAKDAMLDGGHLKIRVATHMLEADVTGSEVAPGPFVQLEVADTGTGMDALTQSRMFEPFFTTKDVGKGTGLGLATVYGIVKQMGGLIRVRSAIGKGTAFLLDFPASDKRELAGAEPADTEPAQGTETLLLVEDEASVRTYLTRLLESHGYRLLVAEHPKAALAYAESHPGPIHLIVSDVVMPGGNGPDLVRAIQQMRPGTPALLISGYADAVLAQRGTHVPPGDFLQKPFSAVELLARIRKALQA